MYNTYVSSTLSLRYKGSPSFSFNDYSYILNDRFDRYPTPLSSQSCCACCSSSICRVPINPSFVFGLRQSSLIQCSASRRLILGGGDRYYCRLTNYDVGQSCCCGFVCPVNERGVSGRRGRLGEGRFRCMVAEKKNKRHRSFDVDDVEVMLSLLSEEVGEECLGVRERSFRPSRRVEVEKRGSVSVSGSRISSRNKKKNDASGLLESNLKRDFESVTIESREENNRRNEQRRKEDKENHLRGEKHGIRREGSSCSSYYTCSSLGELESDDEVQARQEEYREESSSGFKRNSKQSGEVTDEGQTVEEVERRGDVAGAHGIVMRQEKTAVGSYAASSGVDCDWRKKSEKKLTEESIEQTQSWEKSSNQHAKLSEVHETGSRKSSRSHLQVDDREEKSNLAVNIDNETRQHLSKKDDQITGRSESSAKYKHFTGVQEIHDSDIEVVRSSEKHKHVSGREDNSTASGILIQETRHQDTKITKTAGRITRKGDYERNTQQHSKVSKIQEINERATSSTQRQSDARVVKKQEDKSAVILSSVHDTEEHHHLASQRDSGQMDLRRKFQQSTEISGALHIDVHNTSASLTQSEEAKEQHFQRGQQSIRKTESRNGSQDNTSISAVHSGDAQFAASQRSSEKRISSQETYSASVLQSIEETMKRHNLTEERVFQIGPRNDTQRPTKAWSFSEGTAKEASSSQSSLVLKTQPTVLHIGVLNMGDKISSQAIAMPPPSQLVTRDSLHVEPTSDFAIQEVSSATLESGSDSLHTHETYGGARRGEMLEQHLDFVPQDALGSADRLQKSSTQFVGEFIEKVTLEVSKSNVQRELVNEGHKHQQKSLSQHGSGDSKSKEHDSRRSSRSSGVKGPADEIWDVTDPSIQEPGVTEAPESTSPTTKTVAKRTGRSMWNIISDIVRLRWASRSESHNSTQKSVDKSTPNQSASSEAWFSGHEPDENSDENVKRGKESAIHGSTSADQHQLVTIPTGSQGEGSTSASSKDKIGHVGVDAPSPSSISGNGSASKGIPSGPTEENFGRSGSAAMVESLVSMPSLRLRRSPHVDETSASSSLVQEQPSDTGLTGKSGTEGQDGELKRRKLQRNSQVLKDRFEEWEEAYKFESEQRKMDEMFMMEALLEAKKAGDMWEVPVGAVLVQHGKIIARGYNLVEELRDSTAHAEMICIREASNLLRTWRLSETTLYVTLEPCAMCAGAILQARIDTVVWGAPNKLLGADGSWIRLFPNVVEGGNGSESTDKPPPPVHPFHPKIVIRRGVLAAECADAMQQFFQLRRRNKEKKPDSPPPPPPPPPSCLPVSHHPSKFLTKMHDAFHFMFCL